MMNAITTQDKMPAMRGMHGMGTSDHGTAPMQADMPMHQSMMEKRMLMMQPMIDAMPPPESGS